MERTWLKEKRNDSLRIIWVLLLIAVVVTSVILSEDARDGREVFFVSAFVFVVGSIVYRCAVYGFNCLLLFLFPAKKFKINRLHGHSDYDGYSIRKYSAEYTNLDLEWSVPFSVLFVEQEYIAQRDYWFEGKLEHIKDLGELWEGEHTKIAKIRAEENSAEKAKKQKIDSLNKVFKENYK